MSTEKALMVDVSRWQTKVDWGLLRNEGVCGAIVKCGQDLREDKMFRIHAGGARAAGMVVGAYHWFDPLFNPLDQAHAVTKIVQWSGSAIDFVAVDVEQFWADWNEWTLARQGKGTITKIIPGKAISERARAMCAKLRSSLPGKKVVVYTRKTFVEDWAPQMAAPLGGWMDGYGLWLAWYPYTRTKVECGWGEFKSRWLPKLEGPSTFTPGKWDIWQFTGDKFKLPGIGTADVNWFNGDEGRLREWAGMEAGGTEPEPKPAGEQMRARYRMNVRRNAGEMGVGAIVGKVEKGQVVEVEERKAIGEDVWVEIETGWVAEVYRKVRFLEVENG